MSEANLEILGPALKAIDRLRVALDRATKAGDARAAAILTDAIVDLAEPLDDTRRRVRAG